MRKFAQWASFTCLLCRLRACWLSGPPSIEDTAKKKKMHESFILEFKIRSFARFYKDQSTV